MVKIPKTRAKQVTRPTTEAVAKKTAPVDAKTAAKSERPPDGVDASTSKQSQPLTKLDNPALVSTLAALGLAKGAALKGLAKSFDSAPLSQTNEAIESACAEVAAEVKAGGDVDAGSLVTLALESGAAGAQNLGSALVAHLEAWGQLQTPAGQQALEDVRIASIEQLAAMVPADPAEAMARTVAIQQTSTLGKFMGGSFSSDFRFTNEPGLTEAAAQMKVRGGAAVGVSGGVLDLAAATKASSVVLMDVDPKVGNFITALNALFLGMDVVKPGMTKDERKTLLNDLLSVKDEKAAFFLAKAGLPASMLQSVQSSMDQPVRRPSGIWLDDADKIDHLASLARQGRLISIIGDWADPAVAARAQAALKGLGDEVGCVNFSNMPDYVKDLPGFAATLKSLPAKADAEIMTTTWYVEASGEVGDIVGSFRAPVSSPLNAWTEGDAFTRFEGMKRSKSYRGFRLVDEGELEAHRAEGTKRNADAFAPENARDTLDNALQQSGQGMLKAFLTGTALPLPKSASELPAILDQVDRSLDADQRKAAARALAHLLENTPAEVVQAVDEIASAARSYSELRLGIALLKETFPENTWKAWS